MKKYIIPSLIALVLTACDAKEEPDYTTADAPTGIASVHFGSAEQTKIVTDEATSFDVYLYRSENAASEALTVQLLVTDDSGLFRFPAEARFAAGEAVTTIPVGYDVNDMEANKAYVTYIAIDNAATDIYGETTLKLTINYEIYTQWALFSYEAGTSRDGMAVWAEDGSEITSDIRIMERHVPEDENIMAFEAQYYIGEGAPDPSVAYDDKDWTWVMSFSTTDGGKNIEVPQQLCFLENGDYDIVDAYTITGDPSYASYYDKETGTFVLMLAYLNDEGAYGPYVDTFTMNGFEDTTDYGLSITDLGQTAINGTEYALLSFKFNTAEVSEVLYTVVETAKDSVMSAETVSYIAEAITDPDQTGYTVESLSKPGNVALSFPQSGYYSVIAVALNSDGEPKALAETPFEYTSGAATVSTTRKHLAPTRFSIAKAPSLLHLPHTKTALYR